MAQIITFGALLSKAAVRDVGRVLQMPYGQVDRLSKLIPMEGVKPVSIEKALADEPRLREEARRDPQVARLLEIAQAIEGLLRNASTHAAGVVIGDRPLDELVPLYRDPRSDMPATQFNMKWVEEAGLVKFDFLGLKTLTVIQNAVDLLKARGVAVDIGAIPLDDPKTYELYASRRARSRCSRWKARACATRCASSSPPASRTSSRWSRSTAPARWRTSRSSATSRTAASRARALHPSIDPILDETHGIIVYQEQVMEIARKLAGFSLGGADLLRRAMGKKIQAEMDAQKPLFLEGAAENGVGKAKAEEVWNLLDKFANYGFNKSPRRRLRGGQLPDRLAQGQPPGRVHGRGDELRHPPHRQARRLQAGGRPARHRDGAALRQPLRGDLQRRGRPDRLRASARSRTSASRRCG